MDKSESKGSDHPEEEKKVSTLEKPPPGKEMDLVDQVWERLVKTLHQDLFRKVDFKEENAGRLGLRIQDMYCAILLLYNDINKTSRPGPHRDPPSKEEVDMCIKNYGEATEATMVDRVDFNFFFEMFTKNSIRRDELQAFFKTGTNQQFVPLGSHTRQESDRASQEPGPSRNVKTEDSEDHCMKESKELKNAADAEDLKAPKGSWNVSDHGRADSAVNLNSFSGGSHFQIFNFASADMDSLATFVKQIRR